MAVVQENNNFALIRKGYPYGIVADSDPMDRPEGTLADLSNMDYDINSGELITRNPTVNSGLLTGLTTPVGYRIMPDGFKLFSFNQPIDKEVALLFITNGTDVKIFTNWYYNPPASNTDPAGSNNDYENYRSYQAPDTWFNEWVELTEYHVLVDFEKLSTLKFKVDNSALPVIGVSNYYRGWFAWNKTKYNSGTTDQIKNESFVCIESYLESGVDWVFTIQDRTGLNLTNLGWNTGDEVYLMRYPIIVHKSADTSAPDLLLKFDSVKLIKTATSVNILIGQDGNLQFGFLYKDITKKENSNFVVNAHKYYGWWLDYEIYPDELTINVIDVNTGTIGTYSKPVQGFYFESQKNTFTGYNSRNSVIVAKLDFTTKVAIKRLYQSTTLGAGNLIATTVKAYHQYSRRITGLEGYLTDNINPDIDQKQEISFYMERVLLTGSATYAYTPSYTEFGAMLLVGAVAGLPNRDLDIQTELQYLPSEKIYNKATFGVYAQGRMFVSGDSDKPDNVKYSLFQKEDVMPLQNSKPIDAVDRDKNTAMELLSINPVVFKGNSIHIANIEGQTEVGWRMLETKAQTGTNISRSVVRTPSGIAFCNEQGTYLLQGEQEPLPLLLRRKKQAYLALPNKGSIFGAWYGKHNELWYHIGNGVYWICKLSPEEKQIGWKTYATSFVPIGMELSDSGDLYFIGNDFIHKYVNDSEVTNGFDADGNAIVWSMTENFNLLNSRRDKFHAIQHIISIDYELRTNPVIIVNGNEEPITIQVYNEADVLLQSKTVNLAVLGSKKLQITFQNDVQNAQHALKFKISGTMNYTKRFKITELYSRITPLSQAVLEAYSEVRV